MFNPCHEKTNGIIMRLEAADTFFIIPDLYSLQFKQIFEFFILILFA